MHIELKNKVAWITGGGEGIGKAVAELAAECGAKVAVSGRDPEPLDEVVTVLKEKGLEALAVPADVSSIKEMQRAADQIIEQWGRLDIVCANAGINGTWTPIGEMEYSEWCQTLDVNLTGTFLTIQTALPHLKSSGGGSIVIVSSVNGTRMFSNVGASAYAVSKAGQLALGQMLALELAPERIRVNVICPGAIKTGIHKKTDKRDLDEIDVEVEFPEGKIPLTQGKMGSPEQVAQLAVFLASDAASHITGSPVWIDGAQSLLQG